MKSFIYFINLAFIASVYTVKCPLPERCRHEKIFGLSSYEAEKGAKCWLIMCDIESDSFELAYKDPTTKLLSGERCTDEMDENPSGLQYINFRWRSKELTVLDHRLNITTLNRYLTLFSKGAVLFTSVKGFDINILKDTYLSEYSVLTIINLVSCRLEFYNRKKRLNSCLDFNSSRIRSIFQMGISKFVLKDIDYKSQICPIVFDNSQMKILSLYYLSDTFYKKNVLSFSNETFTGLNSNIKVLELYKLANINLDLNLIHPSVFNYTKTITIGDGSLNSISGELFRHLKSLSAIKIYSRILRKINHKQGINWIRQMNHGINVNLSNLTENDRSKEIILQQEIFRPFIPMPEVFPDEDFCIYVDFPFNQLVIVYDYVWLIIENDQHLVLNNEFSCTYLWLAQYFENYYAYFKKLKRFDFSLYSLTKVINSTAFKSKSSCNFEERINLCNKSNYLIRDIWDESDFFILNKKFESAFKLLLYPTAFLGLITNSIVVSVILIKDNSDLFKDFKQYDYLYLNSLFCIMISVIEILSWMTECFYPFEVFCPEIRKLVGIQFFKIIFKECLVTVFRFMCNFTYVAFALNRIGLIGKDHGKLVTFFSEIGIKKYIGITLLVSASLSWIKGFKYEVNYFYQYLNFPISNEIYMFDSVKISFDNFYFIYNSISDLFNYLVFVVICAIIDVCMVVQLRRTLEEKSKKSESMNQKLNETKKSENDEAVKKAIKMVVLNTAIGICFKIPSFFIPPINSYAVFYYKFKFHQFKHRGFSEFFNMFVNNGWYSFIQTLSYFLYTLSLSIQIFIYYRFDKKFRTGYDRLNDKVFSTIKNIF